MEPVALAQNKVASKHAKKSPENTNEKPQITCWNPRSGHACAQKHSEPSKTSVEIKREANSSIPGHPRAVIQVKMTRRAVQADPSIGTRTLNMGHRGNTRK